MAVLACVSGGTFAAGPQDALTLKLDPRLNESSALVTEGRPIYGSGEKIIGRTERDTTIEGDAEMRRAGMVIRGNRLTYYPDDDEIVGVGNVRVTRQGNVFTGPELQLKVDANEGYFQSPSYFLSLYKGRGSAQRVDFLGPERMSLTRSSYTTCSADNPDWYLTASKLEIDESSQEGEGKDANVVFKGRKILWAPSFSFPLGNERRTGFLAPTFSLVSTTGPEILLPYYFNIAPNRDFTLYNRLMVRRGDQLGGHLRYLENNAQGETRFEYNPRDLVTGDSRYLFSSQHTFTNFQGWSGMWNVKAVSDDNYFIDYSRTIIASAERALPRDFLAARAFGDWQFIARAVRYQNILESRAAPPYDRLPQFTLLHNKYDVNGFDLATTIDATAFSRPYVESAEGTRLVFNPTVTWPVERAGWFFRPKLGLHMTSYQLSQNPGFATTLSRTVPTASVDAGMIFERDASFFGRNVRQTLEPRMFYVRTPYRDQGSMPVFDSYEADFNFSQLFAENRFIGNDRIGDANQLTAAIVSRFIEPRTGVESLRLAFGQRFYFSDQRVTIPGALDRTDTRSDILLAASGEIGNGFSYNAGVQYAVADGSLPRGSASVRWRGDDGRILNAGVRYLRDDLGQVDTSWRLPVAPRWTALGRINYSFLRQRFDATTGTNIDANPGIIEGVLGFEYTQDCWVARVVAHRFVTATASTTTALYFQLELSGLGRIGSNPFDILRRNIPGYRLPTDRPQSPSQYFGYE